MLKLPPDIRIALVAKIYGPFGRPGGLAALSTFVVPNQIHHGRRRHPVRRQYATVHVDDTTKLWSQHGKDSPSKPLGTSSSNEETSSHLDHVPSQNLPAAEKPSASTEKEQLLNLVESMLHQSAPSTRPKLREYVKSAIESQRPVAALRELAYSHPHSWTYAMANLKESAPITSRNAAKSNVAKNSGRGKKATETSASKQAGSDKPAAKANFSGEAENDMIQLIDLKYIQDNKPLPTKEEYPKAFERLFIPAEVANAIHSACGKLKLSMQTEVDFSTKQGMSEEALQRLQPGLQGVYVCSLKVDITDIYQETAVGEGISKQTAKQAAWLHMVSKMHVAGTLKELFPFDSSLQQSEEPIVEEDLEPLLEPVEVDKQTMKDEKDAKAEIYNYAAGLGLVPHFETKLVQPRTPRARLGRTPKKPAPLHQVSIRLEGQGIDVTASGKDLPTAETAAAIAFKEQAEQQYKSVEGETSSPPQTAFSVLNVDTAGRFFEFYKNRVNGVNLEVEHEQLEGFTQNNSARVTMNGNAIGQATIMRTKKQAESVAYLTAAIEIASADPQLLHEFAQTLNKGKGKVLRPLNSIDLEIGFESLQSMRNALVEARDAGLPDSRQALGAEIPNAGDELFRRSWRLSPRAHENASEQLLLRQRSFNDNPGLRELQSKKAALPMNHYRKEVLQMIDKNQYSIVVGATGSGKTTQVPQILFEEAIKNGQGSSCNIICTQPRRIAATSVAQRVAVERNESLRKTVGYHVRSDAKLPHEPYGISYCTTGILLEKLKHDPDDTLDTASHIIIDEVHERDLNIDFLMIILKRAIRIRQADGRRVPKVVLMSATLDAELFADYFHQVDSTGSRQPCPTLNVPGRTYPVMEKYLGTIMHELLGKHSASVKTLLDEDDKSNEYLKVETEFSASHSETSSYSRQESVIDWKRERRSMATSEEDMDVRREKEEALVPMSLLVATIAHICTISTDGAILAFLPGLEEILEAQKLLLERRPLGVDFSDASRFQICLLHSTVPKEQQAGIFHRSPMGCRKIILSTNIAETSVTVPEVKYVVDTGKLRERRYDQVRRITKLQCVWESKSNSKQRAGRAGRVQDGFYYALFSKERSVSLRAIGLPELLRSDLQETCLSIKAQNFGEPIASFLAQAIEPPSKQAIDAAIRNLISIEAFTAEEDLTSLGRVLSQLPVHPTLSKMIILGVIFRCLDPMIVLGAAAEERALFVIPFNARQEATRAHRAYGGDNRSDHIAFLKAFDELRTIRDESDMSAVAQRAHESFLHVGAFRVIDQTAKEIEEILEKSGLTVGNHIRKSEYGPVNLNRNSKNYELIRALLLAGFNPNLASKTSSNGIVYRTPSEQSVLMHPSSLNVEARKSDKRHSYGTLFAYSSLSRSTDGNTLFLRDSTHVTPLMAVLFGGQLRMTGDGRLEMDEWLPFFVKASDRQFSTRLILEFRKALDRVLNSAFSSLSDLKDGRTADLTSDPMREKFTNRVVEVLQYASGKHLQNTWSHPQFLLESS